MLPEIISAIELVGGGAAIVFLAAAVSGDFLWPHMQKRAHMMLMQTLTSVCWGGHFYCLDAMTGVGVNALFAIQALLAIHIQRALNRNLIALIPVLTIPILAMTWDGWHSTLPIIACLGLTLARLQHDKLKMTAYCLLLVIAPFTVYGIAIESPLLVACDIFIGVSATIGLFRMLRDRRNSEESTVALRAA